MDRGLFSLIHSQLPAKVSVHLQGWGEPLLHPDIFFHIRQLKSTGGIVSFTTNGTIMDKTVADALVDSGLDGLTFSMAGNSDSTQDSLRGRGSFALLHSAIRTFNAAKNSRGGLLPRVAVSYLLTPKTGGELANAVSWCCKNGVDAFARR
ncbi:MAG: radical SAM protein [Proteobacteria bacterium]|nr:radical SAM protein [Pseudomonadota bacterium]MBU1058731.1 radical SAM protein [Pseudomonadota bacterium]